MDEARLALIQFDRFERHPPAMHRGHAPFPQPNLQEMESPPRAHFAGRFVSVISWDIDRILQRYHGISIGLLLDFRFHNSLSGF